jgi:hypothetical protein
VGSTSGTDSTFSRPPTLTAVAEETADAVIGALPSYVDTLRESRRNRRYPCSRMISSIRCRVRADTPAV